MNKKNNHILTLQTIIIVCTVALPSLSVGSQNAPRPTRYTPRSRLSDAAQKKARLASIPTQPQEEEMAETTDKDLPAEQDAQDIEEDTESDEPVKTIQKATKQAQSATAAPSTWTIIYNWLPQIFVQSFTAGSNEGIGSFSKMLIKQFVQRHTFTTMKNTELDKLEKFIKNRPEEEKLDIQEEDKLMFVKQQFEAKKLNFDELEQQTSPSVIFGTAASIALINTAGAMMGALMKIGLGIAVQLIAPQTR